MIATLTLHLRPRPLMTLALAFWWSGPSASPSRLIFLLLFVGSCSPALRPVRLIKSTSEKFWLWTIDYQAGSDRFVTGGTNGYVAIGSNSEFDNYLPVEGQVTEVEWHPAGDVFAAAVQGGQRSFIQHLRDGQSYVLDSIDDFGARAVGWSPDGTKLAVGDYSGNLSLHDERGRLLTVIKVNDKGIIGLDWSPDAGTIVTVGNDIVLVDVTKRSIQVIRDRQEDILMLCVAYHPSGEYFVTGDYGDAEKELPPLLQYWTAEGRLIKRIEESKGEYRSVEWSHDGRLLATASDRVRLYDTEGELVRQGEEEATFLWGLGWGAMINLLR